MVTQQNVWFAKIIVSSKYYQEAFSCRCMVEPALVNIHTVLPHHSSTLITSSRKFMHQMKSEYVSTFSKKLWGGVCTCKCPYCVATLHSTLIIFSTINMCQSKFCQGEFLSWCSSRNHIMEYACMNTHTVPSQGMQPNQLVRPRPLNLIVTARTQQKFEMR